MWKCKKCGNIEGFTKMLDAEFGKEGNEIVKFHLRYECPSCQNFGGCIEDIADWIEKDIK